MNEPIMIQGPLSASPLNSGDGHTTLTPDHEEIDRAGRALLAGIGQENAAQSPPLDDGTARGSQGRISTAGS